MFNNNADWAEFYRDVEEELPPKTPEPRGKDVSIYSFVNDNHAVNVVTRGSHNGIIMFIQNSPIICFSKKQNTVETATFGNELVALRICKDLIFVLRYKLRIFCVRLERPAYFFCDNSGVVNNMSIPESVLHKKQNEINHHSVCEAVAEDILKIGKEYGETNLADLLAKVVDGIDVRNQYFL